MPEANARGICTFMCGAPLLRIHALAAFAHPCAAKTNPQRHGSAAGLDPLPTIAFRRACAHDSSESASIISKATGAKRAALQHKG